MQSHVLDPALPPLVSPQSSVNLAAMSSPKYVEADALDAIRPGPPPIVSDRPTSGSSGADAETDEKTSRTVAQYDVDPEKQSQRVGSVRQGDPDSDTEGTGRRRRRIKRIIKSIVLAAIFLTFTASVSVAFRATTAPN